MKILNRFTGAVLLEIESLAGADLTRANLYGANLTGADLTRANLYGANLTGADLTRANLYGADLAGADLTRANLYGANLTGADLTRANLAGADLTRANLAGANLYGANLYGANLTRANLAGADLAGADLTRANLAGANLYGANLTRAKNAELVIAQTRILSEGDLIGWKKCKGGVIVKLKIPASAKRSHAFGRKCRAEFAEVLEIFGGSRAFTTTHGPHTEYVVGKTVYPDSFDEDWTKECAPGIHFFITRAEAEAY